ncbi:Basic-leucine zipper transcription factor family protein [Heracleum sosnowskyi]|uniref:Basic-leucine zipper transcription factor family protein n=1 Tax=Heracleum sosnowskyi TaxID=360622 RepID=A0AAD8GST2_9APIA|nr:Basic-leucine zipper transcription factor family protein [Heracleum sosnowskyi]
MMNMDDKSSDLRSPFKAFHHQRGFSDVIFQFPCSIDSTTTAGIRLGGDSLPDIVQLNQEIDTNFNGTTSCINDLDYDAFFSQYIDVDNNNQEEKCVINNLCGDQSQVEENVINNEVDVINWVNTGDGEDKELQLDRTQCCVDQSPNGPPLSKHHSSVPGSIQTVEAKKAMSAAKLAELRIVDPKRAKRIMANRQSAARSKERKARYISELERKVKSLQNKATALATQLNIYKEDALHLAAENEELKLRLQTMEHQAQLQDDITEAMVGEVERLKFTNKFTNGETIPSSSVKLGMQSQAHHHLVPLQCSTPAAADRQLSFQRLPPRSSCQPIISQYWPSLHQQ